jgi:hypothetical protein
MHELRPESGVHGVQRSAETPGVFDGKGLVHVITGFGDVNDRGLWRSLQRKVAHALMFLLHLGHVLGYTLLYHEIVEQSSFVDVSHAAHSFNTSSISPLHLGIQQKPPDLYFLTHHNG